MAVIVNHTTRERITLLSFHIFGRLPGSDAYLPAADISRQHASIFWNKNDWYLKDHSTNGTLVDNEYVRNATCKLVKKHRIQFGNDPGSCWQLLDLAPPFSYLRSSAQPGRILKLPGGQGISDKSGNRIYHDPRKGWIWEAAGVQVILSAGNQVIFRTGEWIFVPDETETQAGTVDMGLHANGVYLKFRLSLDEEHIDLTLILPEGREIRLAYRSHHYLLLALARQRLTDQQSGILPEDQGWISMDVLLADLSREMQRDVDVYFLNLQIFRARRQLLTSPVPRGLFTEIIERRTGSVRLQHPYFLIVKGADTMGAVLPR